MKRTPSHFEQAMFLSELRTNTNINRLRVDESQIDLRFKSSYFLSYPEFLKYFEGVGTITKHNLVIAANFVYGWMPTILDLDSSTIDETVSILNDTRRDGQMSREKLEVIQNCLNKSMVGASKLLHFISPDSFAIWDTRVFRYLTNLTPHHYRLNNAGSYLEYLSFCKEIAQKRDYDLIHKSMERKVGYEMTRLRTIELVMYLSGGSRIKKR